MLEPLGIAENEVMNYAKPLVEKGHEFVLCSEKPGSEEEILSMASSADVLLIANSPLRANVIKSASNLKMISVAFTGVDHVDMKACREKGILVSNSQGYSTIAVAELVFGLIINLLRNVVPCDCATRQGRTKDGLVGNELFGKTLGVVGTGAIGLRVAQIGKAFGCRLLAHSRTRNPEAENLGMEYVTLEELLSESDIVSLHTPLTEETRNLIDRDKLNLMKPSGILINTSRGAVVDSCALADALNSGRIAGAGIDVFEMEPPIPGDHPLAQAKNVVLTPHIAFATKESLSRRAEIAINNISAWLDGKPQNVVN